MSGVSGLRRGWFWRLGSGRPTPRLAVRVLALSAAAMLAAGCSAVTRVSGAVHNAEGNKATVDAFAQNFNRDQTVSFEATYTTTGSSPATIVYAVNPSSNEVAFRSTTTGSDGSNVWAFANSSGAYVCNQSSPGEVWSCSKGSLHSAEVSKLADIYTPSHWINFLKGFSLVAGLTGDKVTSSTMSLNGFDMDCVDVVAKGVPGTSTICSTSQGILGYVKVAQNSTSFEITNYSSSPNPALFQLPPGATVTSTTT